MKKTLLYQELRYIYRSAVIYRKPFSYLYYRFFVGPKIKRLKNSIDRPPTDNTYSAHLLCSHRDILMLLWSLASWHKAVPASGQIYIHEDGSFTKSDRLLIGRLLPFARIIDRAEADREALKQLADFPEASKFRNNGKYIFSLKLIDPYFFSQSDSILVFDTDVLWFQNPHEVLERLVQPSAPFSLYGQKPMEYSFSDGSKLPVSIAAINSGIVGYRKENYSLEMLEKFVEKNGRSNPSRVIEQAGYAYILAADSSVNFLNDQKYSLKSRKDQVARHYTGPVREKFWLEGVKYVWNTRI